MPATERILLASPLALAGGRAIVAPFQFVTSGEDNLQIVSLNSLTGVVVAIQGRRVSADGEIAVFGYSHVPNSDRTVKREIFPLGVGALLNLTMFASAGAPLIGQTFVQAKLIRGLSGGTFVLGTFLQDYITATQERSWPGSPIRDSVEAGGVLRTITGTDPAAGSEWSETVPSGAQWALLNCAATIACSAFAASRVPRLTVDDGATPYLTVDTWDVIAFQNTTKRWFWAQGVPAPSAGATAGNFTLPLPVIVLPAGHRVRSVTALLQSGDDWGAPLLVVRESLVG